MLRNMIEHFLRSNRIGGNRAETCYRFRMRIETAGRTLGQLPQHRYRAIWIRRRTIDRDHAAKRFAVQARVTHHVMPTHRMSDEYRRTEAPGLYHRPYVGHVMARAVAPFLHPCTVAMTPLIQRQHVMRLRERRRDEIPPARMRRATMNQ